MNTRPDDFFYRTPIMSTRRQSVSTTEAEPGTVNSRSSSQVQSSMKEFQFKTFLAMQFTTQHDLHQ